MELLNEASSSLSSDYSMRPGFYTQKQRNKQTKSQLCIVQLHLLLANLRRALQHYIENMIEEKLKIIFNIKHQNYTTKQMT